MILSIHYLSIYLSFQSAPHNPQEKQTAQPESHTQHDQHSHSHPQTRIEVQLSDV